MIVIFQFENEMIAKLDNLVEAGRGDEHYKDLFYEIMIALCENHSTMREQVLLQMYLMFYMYTDLLHFGHACI